MVGSSRKSKTAPSLAQRLELDLDDLARSLNPNLAAALVRLVTRVEALGLVGPGDAITKSRIEQVLGALEGAGIGRTQVEQSKVSADPRRAVDVLLRELEESPVPDATWRHLTAVLQLEAVAALVGVSEASARRYVNGSRATPDDVAFRLHVLAMIVADLAGSYNAYGIRRWFSRPRTALQQRTPAQILSGRWDPDDAAVAVVRNLAASLTAPLAT